MAEKHSITLPAVVDKIIESPDPTEPEKAQINIQEGADPLYKEIRIKNSLTDENGKKVSLTEGQEVEVTVEAQKPENAEPEHDQLEHDHDEEPPNGRTAHNPKATDHKPQ